eukprot:gene10334-biopygen21306
MPPRTPLGPPLGPPTPLGHPLAGLKDLCQKSSCDESRQTNQHTFPAGAPPAARDVCGFFAGTALSGRVRIFFAGTAAGGRVRIFFARPAARGRVRIFFAEPPGLTTDNTTNKSFAKRCEDLVIMCGFSRFSAQPAGGNVCGFFFRGGRGRRTCAVFFRGAGAERTCADFFRAKYKFPHTSKKIRT